MLTLQGKVVGGEKSTFKNEKGEEIPYQRVALQEDAKLETTIVSVNPDDYEKLLSRQGEDVSIECSVYGKLRCKSVL